MELTPSFAGLLLHFTPVFTAPTFQTFLQIATGWILSQRHRYITEVIFSGAHVGKGRWSRFHRFFSHASWNLDWQREIIGVGSSHVRKTEPRPIPPRAYEEPSGR